MTTIRRSLSTEQKKAFGKGEPKTLGGIEIIIGTLTLTLSVTILKMSVLPFKRDMIVLIICGAQLIVSGIALVLAGRRPSFFWVNTNLSLHLLAALLDVAGFGLMLKQMPYLLDSYYCKDTEFLINGIVGILIGFLGLAFIIGVFVVAYGLYTLTGVGSSMGNAAANCAPSPTTDPLYGAGSQYGHTVVEAGN